MTNFFDQLLFPLPDFIATKDILALHFGIGVSLSVLLLILGAGNLLWYFTTPRYFRTKDDIGSLRFGYYLLFGVPLVFPFGLYLGGLFLLVLVIIMLYYFFYGLYLCFIKD